MNPDGGAPRARVAVSELELLAILNALTEAAESAIGHVHALHGLGARIAGGESFPGFPGGHRGELMVAGLADRYETSAALWTSIGRDLEARWLGSSSADDIDAG